MKVRTEAEKGRVGTPRAEGTPRASKKEARRGARATGWFGFMNLGGKRKGAGRKAAKGPDGKRLHQSHSARETFSWSRPVHVTVKVRGGLPNLRGAVLAPVVLKALEAGNEREGFRLVEFSLQDNHWHLICEAEGPKALSAAIKGMNVRVARAINKRLDRQGQVIADRYHLEVLRSPTQVRNALRRVGLAGARRDAVRMLRNGEKHGVHCSLRHGDPRPCPDPLSSAAWFGYWKESELFVLATQSSPTIVRPAQGYLLCEGLRLFERLSLRDAPPGRDRVQAKGVQPARGAQRAQGGVAQVWHADGSSFGARTGTRLGSRI